MTTFPILSCSRSNIGFWRQYLKAHTGQSYFLGKSGAMPLTSRITVLRYINMVTFAKALCNLMHVSTSGATMFSSNIFCDMTLTVNSINHGSYVTLHAIVCCDTVKQNNMFILLVSNDVIFDDTLICFSNGLL